jgi:hypothetical protein
MYACDINDKKTIGTTPIQILDGSRTGSSKLFRVDPAASDAVVKLALYLGIEAIRFFERNPVENGILM